ncbi:MAG: biotin--[acetyl-CoA-carboxylase] ligase [Clostridia bacterium]|nr:biotin--[acetyl-CoA-carboxylase] ligase [Clostridia bacterium]
MKKIKIIRLAEIDSTNNYAKEISGKYSEDIAVIADKQTAGRGRMGRNFFSPEGGIYMSLLIHPKDQNPTDITVMAAVAVARTLESVCGAKPFIKWVNDIYIGGKKVCGILCEGAYNSESKRFSYAVLGIGINVSVPKGGFPDDIKDIAGALFQNNNEKIKEKIIKDFIKNFFYIYNGKKEYLSEYKSRSNVLGKQIKYTENGKQFTAKAVDITESGELVVESEGKLRKLGAGEIKIVIKS